MNKKTKNILEIVFLLIYLILAISLESVYKKPLFEQSLIWESDWQRGNSTALRNFFRGITEFGTQGVIIPLLVIVFLWFPLNKSYTFLSVIIYSSYWCNLMKIIYGNPRPYWVKPSLYNTACDGGFGNPSGHAFSSSAAYLAFWHLVTDYEYFRTSTIGIIVRYSLLVIFLILIIGIILSRVYLGVHGVNQILYGISLGIGLYYIYFHIFSLHKFNGKRFFNLFRIKGAHIFFGIKFLLLITLGFLIWGLVNNDTSAFEPNVAQLCPSLQPYRKYNNDALFQVLIIFALVGKHYGITLLVYLTRTRYPGKEDDINNWHLGNFSKNILRVLLFIVFAIPIILVILIPGDASLGIIFTFKVIFPYLLAIFSIYGPFIFFATKLKLTNPKIYEVEPSQGDSAFNIRPSDFPNDNKIVAVI